MRVFPDCPLLPLGLMTGLATSFLSVARRQPGSLASCLQRGNPSTRLTVSAEQQDTDRTSPVYDGRGRYGY